MIARQTRDAASEGPSGPAGGTVPWRDALVPVVRHVAAGVLAGLAGGFLVGGLGGRIAMRVVALQSPDLQGLTTNDGAATGEISLAGSAVLISFVTMLGVVGGLVYVGARPLLPRLRRPVAWAGVAGVVGASMVVRSDGVDYTVLGSRWVSVAMFSALCVAYGAVTATVAERLLGAGGLARRARPSRLALSFVVLLPGLLIVPTALVGGVATAARATGLPPRGWRRPAVTVGRAVLVVVVLAAAADLLSTVRALA